MSYIIDNFKIIRPSFEGNQSECLDWLAKAHAYVRTTYETDSSKGKSLAENVIFMRRMVEKFCCNQEKIAKRGSEIADFLHSNFSEMKIFNLVQSQFGASMQDRMKFFADSTTQVFEKFYSDIISPPADLIHVTCTGYSSPSPAQLLVSNKNWGGLCNVTNAYHMGCYASIPALRMAQGFLSQATHLKDEQRVDIVHTELCTLHFNPSLHTAEQFVIQSLFADGYISYSIFNKNNHVASPYKNSFEILSLQEVIFPECHDAMTWQLSSFGFSMSISRSVPSIIAENVENFLENMFKKAGYSFAEEKENIIFAIHPGGPKIIEYIADILNLTADKIQFSKEILNKYGNMSSATLPHIWEYISGAQIRKNSLVVSLAFGPGLTIAGVVMRVL